MKNYSAEAVKCLLEITDYRSFIRRALDIRYADLSGWGVYSRFSKAAGFSSRSTPRDIVSGRKRIAPGSFAKFVSGLGLRGDLKEYFGILVAAEESDFNPQGLDANKITVRLAAIRNRAHRKATVVDARLVDGLIDSRDRFAVFAAMGAAETGAEASTIQKRCRFTSARLESTLASLVKVGMARRDDGRYFPVATHADFDSLGGKQAFGELYQKSLEETLYRLKRNPDHTQRKDRLYFDSLFSVDPNRVEEFRTQLRALCMQFIDRSENPNGDGMAKLLVAFEPFGN